MSTRTASPSGVTPVTSPTGTPSTRTDEPAYSPTVLPKYAESFVPVDARNTSQSPAVRSNASTQANASHVTRLRPR